jgi:RimJ/RimL family protein N-acetyltransferase
MPYNPYCGELVRLRARDTSDEPLLHAWVNDPGVTEHLLIRYPMSHATEHEWIAANHQPGFANGGFAIETLEDGKLIGNCGLHQASPENRHAELGIFIGDRSYWGRGYGTDATRTLCRFGFEMMNLHRIELGVIEGNDRARAIYQRLGFVHEGTRRDAIYKAGRYRDIHIMSLLEGELR